MNFVDEVKNYLLRLQQSGGKEPEATRVFLHPAWIRSTVIDLLDRLEASAGASPKLIENEFNRWMEGDFAIRFAERLASLLQDSFLFEASRSEIERYTQLGLALALGLDLLEKNLSRPRVLELKRLVHMVDASSLYSGPEEGWRTVADYAREIRAARKAEQGLVMTAIGGVLASLAGRDAIQWVLNVEVAQSTGPDDEWRISRESVERLLSKPREIVPILYWEEFEPPCPWSTLRRLAAMGLVRMVDEVNDETLLGGYEVLGVGRSVLEALLVPGRTPFSVLAMTLSQDESLGVLQGTAGSVVTLGFDSLAVATARQARLVAHEIRNALIPAKFALDALYGKFVGSAIEAEVERLRPRIDPGIERVLKFVEELLRTSELAARPPEPFELVRAAQDAMAALTTGADVKLMALDELPLVPGYRDRFVLVIVNLLRNAEQAGARNVTVTVKLDDGGQDVIVTVDDDGTGVPEEHRERIFQRGFSLRPGGTGEGLALVKEVIEAEMHGKVACVDKPGGGARFLMRLPLKERSTR